jgi:hypothetical protein
MAQITADAQPVYANRHTLMYGGILRIIFIDERQNLHRVAASETIVAEILMQQQEALILAHAIIDLLESPAAKEANDKRTNL